MLDAQRVANGLRHRSVVTAQEPFSSTLVDLNELLSQNPDSNSARNVSGSGMHATAIIRLIGARKPQRRRI